MRRKKEEAFVSDEVDARKRGINVAVVVMFNASASHLHVHRHLISKQLII